MGQVLRASASTTAAIRRALQERQESLRALAKRQGIVPKTVAKWRSRSSAADVRPSSNDAHSSVRSIEEQAIVVAFRGHGLRYFMIVIPTIFVAPPMVPVWIVAGFLVRQNADMLLVEAKLVQGVGKRWTGPATGIVPYCRQAR